QGFIIFDGLLPLLKSKVAISKGTVLCLHMFAVKVGEPKGIPPENMQNLVGKKIKNKNISKTVEKRQADREG
uniref:AFP-like domain-containing protein n=1 Tax=Oreochromis aureus TaxID=47969 RepID=A0AAZ1Y1S6_OREAU